MSVVIVTGSAGLIGSESTRFFCEKGFDVVGVDNDMRGYFFGADASTKWNLESLRRDLRSYTHLNTDIRDQQAVNSIFSKYGRNIELVVHTAAQPSHDWAAGAPFVDFSVNAYGTLVLLEAVRKYCQDAVFIFTSTNKVYGDSPNLLPLNENCTRYEIDPSHLYAVGINETMSIDQSTHSLFGVSKTAADLMVQEYGKYFGIRSVSFRGGCLTGPAHSGAPLHGFLSYLMKCAVSRTHYNVLGYKGKQVRDNIHCHDLVNAFWHFYRTPRIGEVYNIGGGRFSNCSMLEAIGLCENITGSQLEWKYIDSNRIGDHIWWITDSAKFKSHYPDWKLTHDISTILNDIYEVNVDKWLNRDYKCT